MLRNVLISIFVLTFGYFTQAQHYQPTRVDIKVKKNWGGFNTIACGENGVLSLYFKYEGNLLTGRDKTMFISLFDKDLNEIWDKSIKVNEDLNLIDFTYDEQSEKVYLLFAEPFTVSSSNSSKNNQIEIVTVKPVPDKRSKNKFIELTKHSIALASLVSYEEMQPVNDQLFLFFQENKTPFLSLCCSPIFAIKLLTSSAAENYVFVLDTKKDYNNKSIKLKHNGKYYQYKTTFIDGDGNVKYLTNIVNVAKTGQDKQKLFTLDKSDGSVMSSITMNNGVRMPLQYPSAIEHTKDEYIFVAMYGEEKRSKESGLLFRYFKGDNMDFEQNFSLKEVAGKDNRQKFLGLFNTKDQTNMRFHSQSYKLDNEGNYIIIGERLSPFFQTYYTTDANGNTTSYRVHEGWTYHEAYLMAFNKDHELIWNRQFDMGNTTIRNLSFIPRLKVKRVAEDKLTLMFGMGDEITSLLIEEAEVIGKQESFTLKSQFKQSRIRADYLPSIEYWYKDFFIASGYVNVKKSDFFLSGKDQIYFFTKLKYDK